jgi:hypothetical protein
MTRQAIPLSAAHLTTVVLVALVCALAVGLVAAGPIVGPGTTFDASADGPTVTITEELELDDSPTFPDNQTVDLSPHATFESDGDTNVTVDRIAGAWTNLTTHDVNAGLTVNPGDKQAVTVQGSDVTALNVSAVDMTTDTVDIAYDAGSSVEVTVTDLPADATVDALAAGSGDLLDQQTADGAGEATFSLDAGVRDVTFVGAAAEFTVDVTGTNSPVTEGGVLTVDVAVENVGTVAGERTVELREFDGGTVDSESVSLDAGGEATLTLEWQTRNAGDGTVSVVTGDDEATATVEVDAVPESGGGTSGGDDDDSGEGTDDGDDSDDTDDGDDDTSEDDDSDGDEDSDTGGDEDDTSDDSGDTGDDTDGTDGDGTGEDGDGEDDGDGGSDGSDGSDDAGGDDGDDSDEATGGREPPTGDPDEGEQWVEPTDLPAIEIVEVRLETAPANSVDATSTVALENTGASDRETEVRFVLDGEVVAEKTVDVPGGSRVTVTHTERIEEPGRHEFVSNVATVGADGTTVRTFDFGIGVVELDSEGELASLDEPADAPSTAEPSVSHSEDTDEETDDGFPIPTPAVVLLAGILLVAAVSAVVLAWGRRRT